MLTINRCGDRYCLIYMITYYTAYSKLEYLSMRISQTKAFLVNPQINAIKSV